MTAHARKNKIDSGNEMHAFIQRLYPISRSITGNGVRQTLEIIKEHIPLEVHEVPSGTKVFDWTVPKEWSIRDAYVADEKGKRVIDFKKSNLHVVSYSIPIRQRMPRAELKKHLFTLPKHPNWIPYVTSYYREQWGLCTTQKQCDALNKDAYDVVIDAALKKGFLTYGEFFIKGIRKEEVLISTYICHPSLANDNLSGVALAVFLAKRLKEQHPLFSYRFLFIPETIGAITWLARNKSKISRIKHGLVATCVGDTGMSVYKKSRQGNALIDRAAEKVLQDSGEPYEIIDFFPSGSDERQYCSPGFNLPVGSLMRTPYGRYPQYHTSADNLDFVKPPSLQNSLEKYESIIFLLEHNHMYLNTNPQGEPQLGKRGLYKTYGTPAGRDAGEYALLWVLNLSDGKHSLLDIALRSGMKFVEIQNAADRLEQAGLLRRLG